MTGAPPLAIQLANTTYAVRGVVQDGLRTTADLIAWFERVSALLPVESTPLGDEDLAAARELRDAVRAVARALEDGEPAAPADVDAINRAARGGPHWTELRTADPLRAERRRESRGVRDALAEVAENAIALFTGQTAGRVRLCGRPGCVLLFVKDHPRREWCSNKCGNKVRAARHYQRAKEG
ncbi:ABATE domain-containing protein [Phytomonospora sp. NPDC050363]|uniref:CGNR zinc finger domain-containing protein n=1 Tax=Phytomonospora sp. NPDC050363 TaxID=3155642 RepID=UPI0033DE48A9